jgi:hypothetical protein
LSEPDEGVMSLVMKLLALANDEGASPHERELAEERAEKLMAQHMIDRFEAAQRVKHGDTKARSPIVDTWEVMMSEHKSEFHGDNYEFDYQIIDMMKYVLEHCNVRVNPDYKYGGSSFDARVYTIVGFREDIAYAERIWFNVFKTFVQNVNPQWDKEKSVGFNSYNFACAGLSWQEITLIAEKNGDTRVPFVDRWQMDDPSQPFYTRYHHRAGKMITKHEAYDPNKWNYGLGEAIKLLRKETKAYADKQGLPHSYTKGSKLRIASRNSFARSYRATIKERLDVIRQQATKGEDHVDAGKFAVALRDTRERVDEEFYKVFPQYDPDVRRRKREEEEFIRAATWAALSPAEQAKILRDEAREQAKWERERRTTRRRYRALREDPADRYDHAAWSRGKRAAESVNLRADEEVKDQNRKQLG